MHPLSIHPTARTNTMDKKKIKIGASPKPNELSSLVVTVVPLFCELDKFNPFVKEVND
jgi:hypothetical protein